MGIRKKEPEVSQKKGFDAKPKKIAVLAVAATRTVPAITWRNGCPHAIAMLSV
ncbi:MAG: hypothetical protein NVS9B14_18450 [Candidatus Acidiferrum sp.]